MKPHPRIRKTVKWGGLALTVVLVLTWIGSGFFSLARPTAFGAAWNVVEPVTAHSPEVTNATLIAISGGAIRITYPLVWNLRRGETPVAVWMCDRHPFIIMLRPYARSPVSMGQSSQWIAIWPFVVVAALLTGLLWWLDARRSRRTLAHLCVHCGYELTGLDSNTPCPECGADPVFM